MKESEIGGSGPVGWRRKPAMGTGDFAAGFNDFNQLALFTAARLAGMVTAMLKVRRPFFRNLLARLYPDRTSAPASRKPSRGEALPMLADAIVGSPRDTILAVFGPPTIAALSGSTGAGEFSYWQADTWYYPLPRNGRLAMAIGFEQDTARDVEFIREVRKRQR